MTSTIEQRHLQPSVTVVDHPPVWSVGSCWWCETLFDVCHTDTCHMLQGSFFLLQDARWSWSVQKWFIFVQYIIIVGDRILVAIYSEVIHKEKLTTNVTSSHLPSTGDVYGMSVCPDRSAWWQTVAGRRKHELTLVPNLLGWNRIFLYSVTQSAAFYLGYVCVIPSASKPHESTICFQETDWFQ